MNFVGAFNWTSNSTHRFKRHDNFVTDLRLPTCLMVEVAPYEERCKFVTETEECHESVFVVDYMNLMYCVFAPEHTYLVVLVVLFLLFIIANLFYVLGETADSYFCPSLKALCKLMRLNENLAGVTLLAFGNAAPDLFTSIAGLQGEQREVYNDVLGSCTFIVLLVASAIIIVMPFHASGDIFLRDACFLLVDVIYLDYIVHTDHTVTLHESIILLCGYAFYIFVVIMDQYLLRRAAKDLSRRASKTRVTQAQSLLLRQIKSEAEFQMHPRHSRHSMRSNVGSLLIPSRMTGETEDQTSVKEVHTGLFRQAWATIQPFTIDDWNERHRCTRVLLILSSPIKFVLNLFIPVVDYEEPLNGWSKLLNCLQIVTLPPIVIFGFAPTLEAAGVPAYVLVLVVTFPLSVGVFLITTPNETPGFHDLFSILGAFGSIFVIYACAQETIEILNVIGVVTHRSNSFLGCTLLAWGNSIGDLVSNTTMARHGYVKMGFAACFGGPLFNTLLTIGIIYTYRAATAENYEFETGAGTLGENSTYFLLIGLTGLLLCGLTANFEMRRSFGCFFLFLYVLYLSYALLSEFEVIHGFGSDHRLDVIIEPAV